jgi:ParB family chromosome partitioning protein
LKPATTRRGLDAAEILLDRASAPIAELVALVEAAGGTAIGAYREPLSGNAVLLAALPIGAVEPTPFQRDLSPTHTKRLAAKIEESGSFLDPLVVVRGTGGRLWTPNGRHRLAAAKVLGLKLITALVSPNESLAFRILALNTEKAHNLKDRSLEAIRMARALAGSRKSAKESDFAAEFEEPALLTLGLCYLDDRRFAGGAYHPFLRKVDRFSSQLLGASLREREGFAARLLAIDAEVKRIVAALQRRGFKSAYLPHLRRRASQPGALSSRRERRDGAADAGQRRADTHGGRGAQVRRRFGPRTRSGAGRSAGPGRVRPEPIAAFGCVQFSDNWTYPLFRARGAAMGSASQPFSSGTLLTVVYPLRKASTSSCGFWRLDAQFCVSKTPPGLVASGMPTSVPRIEEPGLQVGTLRLSTSLTLASPAKRDCRLSASHVSTASTPAG